VVYVEMGEERVYFKNLQFVDLFAPLNPDWVEGRPGRSGSVSGTKKRSSCESIRIPENPIALEDCVSDRSEEKEKEKGRLLIWSVNISHVCASFGEAVTSGRVEMKTKTSSSRIEVSE
jgi:hypothetical protein